MDSETQLLHQANGNLTNGRDFMPNSSQENGTTEASQQLHWNPRHLEIKTLNVNYQNFRLEFKIDFSSLNNPKMSHLSIYV